MFNRKSDYALNKKDATAIVYIDADKHIKRLTHEDFSSEEEFLRWKSWAMRPSFWSPPGRASSAIMSASASGR